GAKNPSGAGAGPCLQFFEKIHILPIAKKASFLGLHRIHPASAERAHLGGYLPATLNIGDQPTPWLVITASKLSTGVFTSRAHTR
ncbi:MAG TPA: hypothetical protein VE131_05475, partial [Terriglobales bacterium]|nr:hypothetical protein [Terriglobales bacterium]